MFVLSDFVGRVDFEKPLMIAAKKHEVAAIQVYDRFMVDMPNIGLVKVADSETGDDMILDTSSRRVREAHRRHWLEHEQMLKDLFVNQKIDYVSLTTEDNYVNGLLKLFDKRKR